ncbi:ogr/Delta-like zinc finger family protein [Serratia marcescens]|uniref:Zinc finger Ogr/Delta-type domain-containing protein n=1 Tax=Serratia marcescens TaxID=615 RepID=A0A9X8VJJ3_SERMA|nr:ogr/Delta-like zinc finger family protein [Serratia marcescens]MBS3892279.1 ogr/Delta-like zinc finger family protein [Serratia marcescens]
MYRCPKCGASARTRSSEYLSKTVQRAYHQCNNLHCGSTFRTIADVDAMISEGTPDLRITVPMQNFPRSHQGDSQIEMPV